MKKIFSLVAFITLILMSSISIASDMNFNTKMELKAGQVVTLTINSIQNEFKKIARWDAITVASYNQKENKVTIEILGGRNSLDGAKESTSDYIEKILKPMIELINNSYNLSLTTKDFTVIYTYKRNKKQLLKYENEQYIAL
ncbi:MAG TPA: hypothetical protein ENH30_05435 [Nitrospirae bacterium]|nr:hypothetical protein [Nitrospirota bacterium]